MLTPDHWVTNYASLYADSSMRRLMYLPVGTRVARLEGVELMPVNGEPRLFMRVEYTYKTGGRVQTVAGWIYEHYIEELVNEFPGNVIQLATATDDPNDAAQFNLYRGQVQNNLCGPLCVAFVAGWDRDINWLLDEWQARDGATWKRIFPGLRGRGTDLADLDSLISSCFYDYPTPSLRLNQALMDPVKRAPLVTPGRLSNLLTEHYAIASCRIDGATGRLRGHGVPHWVVLTDVQPDGIGQGWVTLYNPYPNRMQRYSWDEWIKSSTIDPYGLVLKRM